MEDMRCGTSGRFRPSSAYNFCIIQPLNLVSSCPSENMVVQLYHQFCLKARGYLCSQGAASNSGALCSSLIVFHRFMIFVLDLAFNWKNINYIFGISTAAIGILDFFLVEDAPHIQKE